jgi:hypothetical protein
MAEASDYFSKWVISWHLHSHFRNPRSKPVDKLLFIHTNCTFSLISGITSEDRHL